jgi:hypothetical protein
MNFKSLALLLTAAAVPQAVVAGPLAYAICQTGKVHHNINVHS